MPVRGMFEYGFVSCKSIFVTRSEISIDSTIHGHKSVVSQLIWKRRDVLWETFDTQQVSLVVAKTSM